MSIEDLENIKLRLEKSESALNRLINSVPTFIAHWGRDLLNINANVSYAESLGLKPESIKGMHIRDALGPELFDECKSGIEAALKGISQTFEKKFGEGESAKYFYISYSPDIENGEIKGFFLAATDITITKKQEIEKKKLEASLLHSAKFSVMGDMAGGIAHEVNTPLTVVSITANRLKDLLIDDQFDRLAAYESIEAIESTVFKIADIIKSLRTFARSAERDPFQVVSLVQIFHDIQILCQYQFRKKDVILHVPPIHGEVLLYGQETQLLHGIIHLLNNSYEAVQQLEERWIRLDLEVLEETISLSVVDSGKGIPEDISERMMAPFFTTKSAGRGSGLGLTSALGIFKFHGGDLKYDASYHNTKFSVTLPRYLKK